MAVNTDDVADAMLEMVKDAQGKKKLKAIDLTKAMMQKFGDECDKKTCKTAIRTLIDSGKCVYTYFGGSYIEIPHAEGAAGGEDHV
jgi:hypothetical protein